MSVLPFSCVFICTISPLYSFFLSPSSFYSALNLVLLWFKVLLPSELLTCLYSNIDRHHSSLFLRLSFVHALFVSHLSLFFLFFSFFSSFDFIYFLLHLLCDIFQNLLHAKYEHITYYLTNRRFISIIFILYIISS